MTLSMTHSLELAAEAVRYRVLDTTLELSGSLPLDDSWKKFLFDQEAPEGDSIQVWDLPHTSLVHQAWHDTLPFPGTRVIRCGDCIVVMDDGWSQCQVLQTGHPKDLQEALLHLLYAHVVKRGFLQVHSSLIAYQGQGILFLGPSGIGKTTQAELWNRYRGARILNGDLAFVQMTETGAVGYGTPWHGSSPYCENDQVPLIAGVVLKQDTENRIRRLTGFELVSEVAGSIFYPLWVEDGGVYCMDTLNAVLSSLPVYELSCRPEEDAVALLETELKREFT